MDKKKIVISNRGKIPKIILILFAVCLFMPFVVTDGYIMHLAVIIFIVGSLATNYNLAAGYAGQTSFAHAAFYGMGAYTTAILGKSFGLSLWYCIPVAFVGAILTAFLLGLPTLRLKGIYRVICTIGFQAIFDTIILKWMSLTGGPVGITGLPILKVFGNELLSPNSYFYVAFTWLIINIIILWRLESSRLGFELLAIKGDEGAATACGVNAPSRKIWAFTVSSGLAAVTGCVYAGYMRTVSPTAFNLAYSAVILCMALFGGSGTIFGGLTGALLLGILPEIARPVQEFRMILYGFAMIILVLFMPNGVVGEINKIAERLRERKEVKNADVAIKS